MNSLCNSDCKKWNPSKEEMLKNEVNEILAQLSIPTADELFELDGSYVNLGYTLPSGDTVKFLNDKDIYLGAQIELPGSDRCCGVIVCDDFIIICTYGCEGSDAELLLYKKRKE